MRRCSSRAAVSSARRPRGSEWRLFSSPSKTRFALLHESAPALDVILALRAALDRGPHARRVRRAAGFHVLLEDRLAIGDGERRIAAQRLDHFLDRALELGIADRAMHEAHVDRGLRIVATAEEHDLARERVADGLEEPLVPLDVVGEPELRRRNAELRGSAA